MVIIEKYDFKKYGKFIQKMKVFMNFYPLKRNFQIIILIRNKFARKFRFTINHLKN